MDSLYSKVVGALNALNPDSTCSYEEKIKAYEYIYELVMLIINE